MLLRSGRDAGALGATQAWQRLSFLQEELSRVFGAQQHQVPPTPVHMPEGGEGRDENEKEQRRRRGES